MTQTEALRLALEYVELVPDDRYNAEHIDQDALITAIKAALEAKDEPVVWNEGVPAMLPKQKEGETFIVSYEPNQEAKDEPAAWMYPDDLKRFETSETFAQAYSIEVVSPTHGETVPLYTTPPQRKPLTDEEMQRMAKRIEELEAMLEQQTARIVDLQTHIANLEGE
jgi:hypothetical protein